VFHRIFNMIKTTWLHITVHEYVILPISPPFLVISVTTGVQPFGPPFRPTSGSINMQCISICSAVRDGRLRPGARHLANWTKHNASSLILAHLLHYAKNMTSSTKPEVHNVLHCHECRQRRTAARPQVTCTENLVKFGRAAFEVCEPRDLYRHADRNN